MTRASERAWLLTTALIDETPGAVPGSGANFEVYIQRNTVLSLKPRNPDCTFFNVQTQRPSCTFNQCVTKFELCDYVARTSVQRGRPQPTKQRYFYRCNECGRTVEDQAPEVTE